MFTKLLSSTPSARPLFACLAVLCLSLGPQALSHAQAVGDQPEFIAATQQWLDSAVAAVRPDGVAPLRMSVTLGELDKRLRLAPCAKVEPYIPVGTRLWGKTRLGLRCLSGVTRWNVFLPVTVKAYGLAWVIKSEVASGAVLTAADGMAAEVDWAEENSPVVANQAQWVGQVASRALTTGQTVRQGMIKPAQVFQAGAQVRVVAQGAGFQITSDGQALSPGVVGQAARIKMGSGRIMMGLVLDNRTVEIEI